MPRGYHAALNYGDQPATPIMRVARVRHAVDAALLAQLPPRARDAVTDALATLDAADSTLIAGTHQTGTLRFNGRRELAAIDALERHVIDPSDEQSMTAVLDKISGAVLARDRARSRRASSSSRRSPSSSSSRTSAPATPKRPRMNMQIGRLRDGRAANASLLAGAGADLRTWRQP